MFEYVFKSPGQSRVQCDQMKWYFPQRYHIPAPKCGRSGGVGSRYSQLRRMGCIHFISFHFRPGDRLGTGWPDLAALHLMLAPVTGHILLNSGLASCSLQASLGWTTSSGCLHSVTLRMQAKSCLPIICTYVPYDFFCEASVAFTAHCCFVQHWPIYECSVTEVA